MNNEQLLYVPVVEFSTLGVFIMDYCLFQWGWMWGSFDSPTMLLRSREAAKQRRILRNRNNFNVDKISLIFEKYKRYKRKM